MAFEHQWPINLRLCQSTINNPKFYAVIYFVQYIQDYSSAVNYNTTHSKIAYKYFLKDFYNKIKKNKYNTQIQQHNIRHVYIILITKVIILEKSRKRKRELIRENEDKIILAKVVKILSRVNLNS